MLTEVYFCQLDINQKRTCAFIGELELTNFDLLDTIPYNAYNGQTNIYDYLTVIGKAKVESMYPAPEFITDYLVTVKQSCNEFESCPTCTFNKFDNLVEGFRKFLGVDKESLDKKRATAQKFVKIPIADIIKNGWPKDSNSNTNL